MYFMLLVLLGDNIVHVIKHKAVLVGSKDVGVELNTGHSQ